MSWQLDGKPIRSVLLTRLRYLGDIVMSTVLVEALRQGDPDLEIGYLCEDGFAPVLEGHPGIDRLHRLRTARTGRDAASRVKEAATGDSLTTLGIIRELRHFRYDLAVDMFFNPRSAWLLKLSGTGLRIGGTRKSRGRLYTHRILRQEVGAGIPEFARIAPGGLGEHLCRLGPLTQVETGLPFADWLVKTNRSGPMKPWLGPNRNLMRHSAGLNSLGLGKDKAFLLLAPCATWDSKQWPLSRWAELIPLLLASTDLSLAVMVAPGKESEWASLGALIPPERGGLLPAMPLPEALSVAASARAVLTVDGGLMHAAVGLNIPTVAIFGPTDPSIWFPYENSGPFRVLARMPHCHPCDLHQCPAFICLPELEAKVVRDALMGLLEAEQDSEGGAR